ncbi:hypothetical protein QJQ45_003462 [Haematococcus lacustris]|nr:hypothetical protein QJQ45_003462 [Haematococcus lacustris]
MAKDKRKGSDKHKKYPGKKQKGAGQRRGKVVLVDEHRTTRVSSAVNGKQPCEEELDKRRATRPVSCALGLLHTVRCSQLM